MVDTRLRGEWLHNPRFDDLSNGAWRLMCLAMMWSNEQGTDGAVPKRYLRMLHPDVSEDLLPELLSAGMVTEADDSIQFVEWVAQMGQSPAEKIAERRRQLREAQAVYRQKHGGKSSRAIDHVIDDVNVNVGQAQDREATSLPGAYVNDDVIDYCPKHPNGDTGEPCGTCMKVRQARDERLSRVKLVAGFRGFERSGSWGRRGRGGPAGAGSRRDARGGVVG